MDGRGRLAEPVTDGAATRPAAGPGSVVRRTRPRRRGRTPIRKLAQRWSGPIFEWHIPRGAGVAGALLLLLASLGYGAVRGEHMPVVMAELRDARDAVANMF